LLFLGQYLLLCPFGFPFSAIVGFRPISGTQTRSQKKPVVGSLVHGVYMSRISQHQHH